MPLEETEATIAPEGDGGSVSESAEVAAAEPVGELAGRVELEIDYAIIRHFSEHLYGSPNKAIEELVANSFDAMATLAYVYVPGGLTHERVVVWDDGESMNVAGLQAMWKIARSPKQSESARLRKVDGRERRLIGKFGIGKLASYAIGERISHLCKRDGDYLLVGVDYRRVQEQLGEPDQLTDSVESNPPLEAEVDASATEPSVAGDFDDAVGASSRAFRTDIRRLTEDEARHWASAVVAPEAEAFSLFGKSSFTLAVVDRLHEDLHLPPGRLGWILGNAMPLRPDFVVKVDDDSVQPKLGRNAKVSWDASEKKVQESLKQTWASAVDSEDVDGEPVFGTTYDVPPDGSQHAVVLPALGPVVFRISLFTDSLQRENESKDERSHGFFLMVRGRLINTDDPAIFLAPPSYGTFYRMQIVVHADGLDGDLLADRGRLRDSRRTREFAVLQRALYRAARGEIERQDEASASDDALYHLLPTRSRRYFREPLNALLMDAEDGPSIENFHFDQPDVLRDELPENDPLAVLAQDGSGFTINVAHPFFQTLREAVGTSAKAEKAMRAFELVAVSERLLEGYLLDIGVERDKVSAVLGWRDDLFRQLAVRYRDQPNGVIAEVWTKSYKGKKAFEVALAKLFNLMGFVATRRGASGDEDVLVVAPTGLSEVRFIVDAKGSRRAVKNDTAELAQAVGHLDGVEGAHVAIVVAREFVGFKTDGEPAVLRDCRKVSEGAPNRVSIVDVPTLIELYRAVERWSYPLELILPVLAEIESPEEKRQRIAKLDNPVEAFDYHRLLSLIWKRQQEEAAGDVVPYRSLWQVEYKDDLTLEDLETKFTALEVLARPLLRLDTSERTVSLSQSPDVVTTHIQHSLEAVEAARVDEENEE